MAACSLFVFCIEAELEEWIRILCREKRLGVIEFRDSETHGSVGLHVDSFKIHKDTYRLFLFPSETPPSQFMEMNSVKSRNWGWIDIRPGHLLREEKPPILLYSEIHGEDFDYEPVHPARYVRWLKRKVHSQIIFGVKGVNTQFGGESVYRNIAYSNCAFDLFTSGVCWKQNQMGPVAFYPVVSPAK